MTGLLLKDFYQFWKYGKMTLFIIVFFAVFSTIGSENLFIIVYPCVFACNITLSLISYDEHDKWDLYALSLPYTRKDLVSAKYLFGLLFGLFTSFLMLAAQSISMVIFGIFSSNALISLLSVLLFVCFIPSAVQLVVTYRFGTGKGRIVFIASIAIFCGVLYGFYELMNPLLAKSPFLTSLPPITLGVTALLAYGLSWMMSVKIYENKKL